MKSGKTKGKSQTLEHPKAPAVRKGGRAGLQEGEELRGPGKGMLHYVAQFGGNPGRG